MLAFGPNPRFSECQTAAHRSRRDHDCRRPRRIPGITGEVQLLGSLGGYKKTFRACMNSQTVAVQIHHHVEFTRYERAQPALLAVRSPHVVRLLESTTIRIANVTLPVFIGEF